MKIYYIGGSPCSGKSTIAEMMAKKFDLYYFKVDDMLEKYTLLGTDEGYEICRKQLTMSPEQIWMRDVDLQCQEELQFYHEIFGLIQADIKLISGKKGMIAEGAAFLPEIMQKNNITDKEYICMTPTKEFQIEHYRKREWVPYVLEGCSDKEKAFENWMDRDVLFAETVRRQCENANYKSIVVDGKNDILDILSVVCQQFELG